MGVDRRAQLVDSDDDMPTLDLQAASPSLADDDFEQDALPPTNRDADHHTIVDMNLRTVRFMVVVAVALVVAFAYALFTSHAVVLEVVDDLLDEAALAAKVKARVSFYNVLLGAIMFASGKVFETYTEMLIFPTIHTYLHNCSLYPGDAPQRTTSAVKTRAIFWGLKTVVILMNVGTASLFVNQRTRVSTSAVTLSVESHARRLQEQPTVSGLDPFTAFGRSDRYLHDLASTPCESTWTIADVDYTSVSVGVKRQPWSDQIVQTMGAPLVETDVELRIQDCTDSTTATCERVLESHGVRSQDVARLIVQGLLSTETSRQNASFADAATAILTYARSSETTLSLSKSRFSNGMTSLTATITIPREVPATSVVCGAQRCVVAADVNPPQEITVQQTHANQFFTSATTRSASKNLDGSVRENLLLSFASVALPVSAHDSVLRLALDGEGNHLVVNNAASLNERPTRVATLNSIVLPETTGLKTWLPLDATSPSQETTIHCDQLVDGYSTHFHRQAAMFSASQIATSMASTTLLYAVRDAALENASSTLARRLSSEDKTVKLTLSISVYSAVATFSGCGIMVLLMVFVIMRPAARVRLTPNTTPAAQYVQILTDDLYPNIVHKKRLRFVNGEVLPFNEYVVDSIVLHAKRDESKKIYL